MNQTTTIVDTICQAYPTTEAIYLFGSWSTPYQRADSDLDVAVLLPHDDAKQVDTEQWNSLAIEIAGQVRVECADLINLRCVYTSFQAEILNTGKVIHCTSEEARISFEALVLSMYQKLNYERAGIREEIIKSGRVLAE